MRGGPCNEFSYFRLFFFSLSLSLSVSHRTYKNCDRCFPVATNVCADDQTVTDVLQSFLCGYCCLTQSIFGKSRGSKRQMLSRIGYRHVLFALRPKLLYTAIPEMAKSDPGFCKVMWSEPNACSSLCFIVTSYTMLFYVAHTLNHQHHPPAPLSCHDRL